MPFKSKFSTDDSIQIVAWWYELKDIHKVRWRYAKEKGIKKFPRKLPCNRKVKPKTLEELQEVVSDFVSNNYAKVRRAVRDAKSEFFGVHRHVIQQKNRIVSGIPGMCDFKSIHEGKKEFL